MLYLRVLTIASAAARQRGAGMAEYVLLVSFVGVALVGALINFRAGIDNTIQTAVNAF